MFEILEYDHILNCDRLLAKGKTLQDAFKEFESMPHNVSGMVWIRRREIK